MNRGLTLRWNELVKPRDIVYHLGDFAMGKNPEEYIKRLHGKIRLIRGNHDKKKTLKKIAKYLDWVEDVFELNALKQFFWLSHYAHMTWPRRHHGSIHLFGHSHGNLEGVGRSMDVGVDAQNYYPIHLDMVIDLVGEKV